VAINLAAELAEQGHRVLLIDADTYGGSIAPSLGIVDESAGFAAVCRLAGNGALTESEVERLSHRIDTGHQQMTVLTGIVRSDRWPELSAERVTSALSYLKEHFDYIVADVGFNLETDEEITSDLFAPRRNAATLTMLKHADRVVEVAGADALSVARFIRAHNDLVEQFPETQRVVVLNKQRRILSRTGAENPAHTLARYAGIRELQSISEDRKLFERATSRGGIISKLSPKAQVLKEFKECAVMLTR
jgi:MinD-like ATPase involved in chromosome partitioning or flagellar assembly